MNITIHVVVFINSNAYQLYSVLMTNCIFYKIYMYVIFCFLSLQEVDNDIESIGSEGAVNYDRLIKQTLAKKRKSRRLRFTCAVFTFLIVVAVVVVLVIFVGQKQS